MGKKIDDYIPDLKKILGKGYEVKMSMMGKIIVRKDNVELFRISESIMADGFIVHLNDQSGKTIATKVASKLKMRLVE